jgi:hypothetical protein
MLATRLRTPLQVQLHLTLALDAASSRVKSLGAAGGNLALNSTV